MGEASPLKASSYLLPETFANTTFVMTIFKIHLIFCSQIHYMNTVKFHRKVHSFPKEGKLPPRETCDKKGVF